MDLSEQNLFKEILEALFGTCRNVTVAIGAKSGFTAKWIEALQAWMLSPNKQAGCGKERKDPCRRVVLWAETWAAFNICLLANLHFK